MRYRFDHFELDTGQFLLRGKEGPIHAEPLVFDLLRFFVERPGQVVTREAIIEAVWKGRFVSDATISSCIKSARRALGDSGQEQRYIRTMRGRGFQFTAAVTLEAGGVQAAARPELQTPPGEQTSLPKATPPPKIAVFPFFPISEGTQLGLIGDALAQEVILELSRLHWLFVIARGSSFQFRGRDIDILGASEILGASYFLTGTLMQHREECVISVELTRTPENTIVWADRFVTRTEAIMHLQSTLAGEIASALEPRIQFCEASHAAKVPTEHLDAWAAYHRGLSHMYRFNKRDNGLAVHFFEHAVRADPDFARAQAGLSFTHFQNAFLGFTPDLADERRKTREHAERSMELDPLDPFVNLTMGRAEWLSGDLEGGLPWMERAIALSPNYAFAIYNSALVGTLLGEGEKNEIKVAKAIALSPIDPLNYAMLATRALTYAIRGDHIRAAEWAERAIRSPNAHIQIYTIAAFTSELAGNRDRALEHVRQVRLLNPHYSRSVFLKAFPLRDREVSMQVEQSLQRLGL